MKILDKKDALNKFLESAISYTELEGGENHKHLNKQFDKISNCAGFLKKNNELYELKQFLEDKNLGVVAWAAYFLLTVDEELAIKKLKMIEDAKKMFMGGFPKPPMPPMPNVPAPMK